MMIAPSAENGILIVEVTTFAPSFEGDGSERRGRKEPILRSRRHFTSSAVTAAKTMIERTRDRLDLWPERLIADTGYGSVEMLNWLVNDRGIEPHIPVFDKSKRTGDTFSREDFVCDHASDSYRCPADEPTWWILLCS